MFLLAPMGGVARADERVPAPIEIKILDSNQTLYFQGAYSNPQGFGNGVWSIGHQRQGGTYEVPLELKNISAGEDLGLFVSVVLAADDWIVEQDPSGSVVDVGESAYARIRLDTSAPMAAPSICAIQLIITQGSTSYDPILIVLRAESVQAIDAMDQDGVPEIKELTPGDGPASPMGAGGWTLFSVPDHMPAANFVHAPHAFIGWDLDANGAGATTIYVGVHAAIEGGINRVEFYLKGNTATITSETIKPESQSAEDVPAFYVKIRRDAFNDTEPTPYKVWARVFANDPNQKPRVIGPWAFWVFPSGTSPHVVECQPSSSDKAHIADDDSALWRALLELMQSEGFSSYAVGNVTHQLNGVGFPPSKPVVLRLHPNGTGPGWHVLPNNVRSFRVTTGGAPPKKTVPAPNASGLRFDGWTVPLVLMPASGTADPNVVLTAGDIEGVNFASPDRADLDAPIVIYRNFAVDQKVLDSIEVEEAVWAPVTDPNSFPITAVFHNCAFFDTNGRFALYDTNHDHAVNAMHAGLPPSWIAGDGTGFAYYEQCTWGDNPATGGVVEGIHRGVNKPMLLRGCTITNTSGDMTNNAHAMFKCTLRDLNPQPHRRDLPVGELTYLPGATGPGGIRKVGSNASTYALTPNQADVASGALLLYENDPVIPAYVIALDGRATDPVSFPLPTSPPQWGSVERRSVLTVADLVFELEDIAASKPTTWQFNPDSCVEAPNNRAAYYLTRTCEGGASEFPTVPQTGPKLPPVKCAHLTTSIDVHQDVLQWFDDNVSPIDNRTYWSVDYDFVNKPSGVYPDPDPFPCYMGHPCPTSTQGCPCGGPCAPWPSYREVEYSQGLLINDTEQGVYNCALRAVRLHMREDYDEFVPACQFAGPMTNVLLSNFAISGQPLALRNDNPGLPSNFVPQFVTIRDSSFLAIGFENYHAASDPPNAQTQCCGTLNGTVPPQYTIGQILAPNNHYVFMCGGTNCSAVTPWTAMGFCVPPNGSGPAQPAGGQLAVYAAPGLNTGGDCTWGYGELLDDNGHPLLLSEGVSSPLVRRTRVIRLKYYLDGEPVDKCGSTNGADPIGPLGDN